MGARSCGRATHNRTASAPAAAAETRELYIVTVHIDGKTNVKGDATRKPEAFPDKPGIVRFQATDRAPSMQGQVVVLPRS